MNLDKYHNKNKCHKCGGENKVTIQGTDEGYISECDTTCTKCGFQAYWGYGFFHIEPEDNQDD